MPIIFLTFASIIAIYLILTLAGKFLPIKICSICASVAATWLWLLIGYWLNWHANVLIIGILMGGSVAGLMYKTSHYFAVNNLKNFWLARLLIITFGFLGVNFILTKQWSAFSTVIILATISGFLFLFFVKGKKPPEPISEANKKTLEDNMKHCCD